MAANQSESTDFNARVGANIKRSRQALGMTQAQLAHELTERGFPFQQQTILKVEKGSRPLRFEEAQAVAEILRTNTAELSEFSEDNEVAAAAVQLRNASQGYLMRQRQITDMEKDRERYKGLAREAIGRLADAGVVRKLDSDGVFRWRWRGHSDPVVIPGGSPWTSAVLDNLREATSNEVLAAIWPAVETVRNAAEEDTEGDTERDADG